MMCKWHLEEVLYLVMRDSSVATDDSCEDLAIAIVDCELSVATDE